MSAYLYTMVSLHVKVWSLTGIFSTDIKIGGKANLKGLAVVVHKMESTIIIRGSKDETWIVIEIGDAIKPSGICSMRHVQSGYE